MSTRIRGSEMPILHGISKSSYSSGPGDTSSQVLVASSQEKRPQQNIFLKHAPETCKRGWHLVFSNAKRCGYAYIAQPPIELGALRR